MILVTGATGYIAGRLVPQLLARGYPVRALARDPKRIAPRSWSTRVELLQGDVTQPASLPAALQGVHTAYYLVHNMSSGHGYTRIEIQAAENFARAAAAAGAKHIIYLGGLADPEQHLAPHMRSRIETGVALRSGSVPVTEFRAGVIIGSGSISFEMIRFVAELFPVIPGPRWLKNRAQPIAAQNVIDYLLAALESPQGQGQVFEIGGQRVVTYQRLMQSYARARGLKRGFILFPYLPPSLMALGISLVTPVPRPIAYALVGGLSRDSVVLHDQARGAYPVNLIDFDAAAADALENLHPQRVEPVWTDDLTSLNPFKHEGFFIDRRSALVAAPPEKCLQIIQGFQIKNFEVENKSAGGVLLRAASVKYGKRWLAYQIQRAENATRVVQTSYFAPRGSAGFIYGYLLYPFYVAAWRKARRALSESALPQSK